MAHGARTEDTDEETVSRDLSDGSKGGTGLQLLGENTGLLLGRFGHLRGTAPPCFGSRSAAATALDR